MKITKEMLEKVLGIEIVNNFTLTDEGIYYGVCGFKQDDECKSVEGKFINIYEFIYKVKKWISENTEYEIMTSASGYVIFFYKNEACSITYSYENEIEAVLEAYNHLVNNLLKGR